MYPSRRRETFIRSPFWQSVHPLSATFNTPRPWRREETEGQNPLTSSPMRPGNANYRRQVALQASTPCRASDGAENEIWRGSSWHPQVIKFIEETKHAYFFIRHNNLIKKNYSARDEMHQFNLENHLPSKFWIMNELFSNFKNTINVIGIRFQV